ncbi:argininosuccinate synthase [Brochothrix thermosphacta]|uniref:argininosuccinate synthase n=1 Tax=Brochothrix thermosphacta TaxID=2756 RepID=UPI0003E88410|nr:argininosuccinate synthase [Brochothrix thermosphacta]EUJ38502.1 argininosuccinate synthase [Brochothrix thermosphacta DSM 20171 = FSL F6-1036]ODJ47963.1 argininosuccinate synthase [Brochothrix thermosphacta DSM 20171 = FSL F6-1036]
MKEKVVLAYSGGLDTSVAIKWLQDKNYDVIAVCLNVGEGKDLDFVKEKALTVGAIKSIVLDVVDEFINDYALISLQAHTLYEGVYPLISALSRPLIAKKLVEIVEQEGAVAVAHGCTGKGNDQVRFEVSFQALAPNIKVLAPVRDWKWSREEEIEYAIQNDIPIPINLDNPYSVDQNLWGRAIECGVLEDPWATPPAGAYELTISDLEDAPDQPEIIELSFEKGVPSALNGQTFTAAEIVAQLNDIAGKHGVGQIDHIENRVVGIKSRELYEAPGAMTLITAHKALESITLIQETAHFKPTVELQLTQMIYDGLWFNPLTKALIAFIKETQENVTGTVRLKLYKGQAIVVGRKSPVSLYNENLATYTSEDTFDQDAAVGFIKLWGLSTKVNAEVQLHAKSTVHE